jgi:hypothetical protein
MTYNIYSLDTPLPDALAHYQHKHAVAGNVVRVHPENVDRLKADGVKVVEDMAVLKGEYWVGSEDELID